MFFLLALAMVIGQVWYHFNGNKNKWLYDWFFVLTATFFGRFFEFYIGLLLALNLKTVFNHQYYKPLLKKGTYWFLLATLMVIIIISFLAKGVNTHGVDTVLGLLIRNILLPMAVAGLLFYLIFQVTLVSKMLSSKLMVLLGNASFFFYLIHVGAINHVLSTWVLLPDRNFILLWLISIMGYWLIEKPTYSFLKAVISNKFGR